MVIEGLQNYNEERHCIGEETYLGSQGTVQGQTSFSSVVPAYEDYQHAWQSRAHSGMLCAVSGLVRPSMCGRTVGCSTVDSGSLRPLFAADIPNPSQLRDRAHMNCSPDDPLTCGSCSMSFCSAGASSPAGSSITASRQMACRLARPPILPSCKVASLLLAACPI